MSKFSPQLHSRITEYFRKKYGIEIGYDEAEMYLNSLADLLLCLNAGGCGEAEMPAGQTARRSYT